MREILDLMFQLLLDPVFILIIGGLIYFSGSLRSWFLSFNVGASLLVVVRVYLADRSTEWIAAQLGALLTLSIISLFIRNLLLAGHSVRRP